jgi:hypothetical protein
VSSNDCPRDGWNSRRCEAKLRTRPLDRTPFLGRSTSRWKRADKVELLGQDSEACEGGLLRGVGCCQEESLPPRLIRTTAVFRAATERIRSACFNKPRRDRRWPPLSFCGKKRARFIRLAILKPFFLLSIGLMIGWWSRWDKAERCCRNELNFGSGARYTWLNFERQDGLTDLGCFESVFVARHLSKSSFRKAQQ